jgi:hypothetical protein
MNTMRVILLAVALCLAMNPLEAAFLHKSGPKTSKPKRNNFNGRKNTHKPVKRAKAVHSK